MEIDGFHGCKGGCFGAEPRGAEVHGDKSGLDRLRRLFAAEIPFRADQYDDPFLADSRTCRAGLIRR